MRKKRTLEQRLSDLEKKRERNVNRYIIPVEMEIERLREKIIFNKKK
jgi:hypothetical protein